MQQHISQLSPQEAYWYFFSQGELSNLLSLAKQDWKDAYFLLMRVWTRLIGTSPEALHMLPVSLHLVSTLFVYSLFCKWFTKGISLMIAAAYLSNPYSWVMVYQNPRTLFTLLVVWFFVWGTSRLIPKRKKRQRIELTQFRLPLGVGALLLVLLYTQQTATMLRTMPHYAGAEVKAYIETNLRGDDGVVLITSDSFLPYLFDYYSIDYYRSIEELPRKIYRVAVISHAGVAAPNITGYTKTDEHSIHQLTITWYQKAPSQTP